MPKIPKNVLDAGDKKTVFVSRPNFEIMTLINEYYENV